MFEADWNNDEILFFICVTAKRPAAKTCWFSCIFC